MTDKTPVRVVFDGSGVATGLGEFQTGETVPLANGGTGSALSIGTAGQVMRVNAAGTGLEFADQGDIDVIASSDSTGVQVQDDLNISGTLSANNIDVNSIVSRDSTEVVIDDGFRVTGTANIPTLEVNQLSSGDSPAIQLNDSINISGTATASSFVGDGSNLTNLVTTLQIFADDSTTMEVDLKSENLQISGGNSISTSTSSTQTLTIALADDITVNAISSNDSTEVHVNDAMRVSGDLQIGGAMIFGGALKSNDSTAIQIQDGLNVSGVITSGGTPTNADDVTTKSFVESNFAKSGFPNSTATSFPTSDDSSATDYQEGSDGIGSATTIDAFGVSLITLFDCMEPIGSTATTDLGSSESFVGE